MRALYAVWLVLASCLVFALTGDEPRAQSEESGGPQAISAGEIRRYGEIESSCVKCHTELGEYSEQIVRQFSSSIHRTVDFGCQDCHGGDPKSMDMEVAKSTESGFIGKPRKQDIPLICARCHDDANLMRQHGNLRTDQLTLFRTSAHGIALLQHGDENAASCIDCHSAHEILRVNDPRSPVHKLNQPETCAKCHADAELMERYGHDPEIPSNYIGSVHGVQLLVNRDLGAPVCSDCHGSHGALPPGIETIQNVCANCHVQTERYYSSGKHAAAFEELGLGRCVTCHDQHKMEKPTDVLLSTSGEGLCIMCHSEDTPEFGAIAAIGGAIGDIRGLHEDAERLVEDTEHTTHLSMHDMRLRVEQINTLLITARAQQHATDAAAMAETRATAQEHFDNIQAFTVRLLERSRFNKGMVLLLAALLLAYSIFLIIYRRLVIDKTNPWVPYGGEDAAA